jgi:hypothetical protein
MSIRTQKFDLQAQIAHGAEMWIDEYTLGYQGKQEL